MEIDIKNIKQNIFYLAILAGELDRKYLVKFYSKAKAETIRRCLDELVSEQKLRYKRKEKIYRVTKKVWEELRKKEKLENLYLRYNIMTNNHNFCLAPSRLSRRKNLSRLIVKFEGQNYAVDNIKLIYEPNYFGKTDRPKIKVIESIFDTEREVFTFKSLLTPEELPTFVDRSEYNFLTAPVIKRVMNEGSLDPTTRYNLSRFQGILMRENNCHRVYVQQNPRESMGGVAERVYDNLITQIAKKNYSEKEYENAVMGSRLHTAISYLRDYSSLYLTQKGKTPTVKPSLARKFERAYFLPLDEDTSCVENILMAKDSEVAFIQSKIPELKVGGYTGVNSDGELHGIRAYFIGTFEINKIYKIKKAERNTKTPFALILFDFQLQVAKELFKSHNVKYYVLSRDYKRLEIAPKTCK